MKLKPLLYIIIILSTAVASSAAADVFDAGLKLEIKRSQLAKTPSSKSSDNDQLYTSMIIQGNDAAFESIENIGGVIFCRRSDMACVCIPRERLSDISTISGITRVSRSRYMDSYLDRALPVTGVSTIHSGAIGDKTYTGRGVVAGFTDGGFDATHPAFKGRIAEFHHYIDTLGQHTTPIVTDNADMYHATHVAGILAGEAAGTPYGGVAPGATIVGSTSIMHDAGILAGIESVISYAKTHNMPAVVNMSIGSTMGPHDGTDLFCRYLDLCAEDAVIALSAGNNGGGRVYLPHDFTEQNPTVEIMPFDKIGWTDLNLSGALDIWFDSDQASNVRLRIWDGYERSYIYTSPYLLDDTSAAIITAHDIPDIAQIYTGTIGVATATDSGNGRRNLTVEYDLSTDICYPGAGYARYNIIFEVSGPLHTHADIYTDGTASEIWRHNGAPASIASGTSARSISSLACGFNTISVGAATTRTTAPRLDGGTDTWADTYTDGTMASFSSYGTLDDGRVLPHISAPGCHVISAASGAFAEAHPQTIGAMAYRSAEGGYYLAECGTSMSSPHAAGIFALWLEADPTLTPAQIREIAIATAKPDGAPASDPRSGAGMIDAVAGLRRIINQSSAITTDVAQIRVWRDHGKLRILAPERDDYQIDIYDLAGRKADAGNLPNSPVIVRISTPTDVVTRKI